MNIFRIISHRIAARWLVCCWDVNPAHFWLQTSRMARKAEKRRGRKKDPSRPPAPGQSRSDTSKSAISSTLEALHSLVTSIPPKNLHAYVLDNMPAAPPDTLATLASFFATLSRPPLRPVSQRLRGCRKRESFMPYAARRREL